jgi:CheY-like chemotaxis protein
MPGRMLIVEDDATRYAISRLLEKDGFSVDVVDDGQAGIDARTHPTLRRFR